MTGTTIRRQLLPSLRRALSVVDVRVLLLAGSLLFVLNCGENQVPTELLFDTRGTFWDSPFPSEHRRTARGQISLQGLPNPERISVVSSVRRLIESDAQGFGVSSTIYFRADGPLDTASLPSIAQTFGPDASVFLIDVDPSSRSGERVPLRVGVVLEGGPMGAPQLLALQPLQGWPLREETLYAAVVLRDFGGWGQLGVPATLRTLVEGRAPDGFSASALASYQTALAELDNRGVDPTTIAGLAVFRTGRPSEAFFQFEAATQRHRPRLDQVRFVAREVFDRFCVYEAEVSMPLYQSGIAPYPVLGGGWPAEAPEAPPQRARSRIVLTVPRAPIPSAGFPTVLFVRTGGGGDRPLVDRGRRASPGGPAIAPGTGPALEFAQAGFAGLSWDGPHGGLRNPTGGDEQFLMFNFSNPEALRDNVRQTALEAVMLSAGVGEVESEESCPGVAGPIRLDPSRITLMGHSMGATVAPLAAATGRFEALLLSGAGASWIENVLYKESPLRVRPLAALVLGYPLGRPVGRFDPILSLLQWAGEPADPPIYFRKAREEGRLPHMLMMQGVGDTYIPSPIANAASLAADLDLAGTPTPAHRLVLDLIGADARPLPAGGNRDAGTRTAILTQHPGGPVEDPHEVVFQTEPPKRLYRCFLKDLAAGRTPILPDATSCP